MKTLIVSSLFFVMILVPPVFATTQECTLGTALINFSEEFASPVVQVFDGIAKIGVPEFDLLAEEFGFYEISRIFPHKEKPTERYMVDFSRWHVLRFPAEISVAEVVAAFEGKPFTEAIEPEWKYYPDYTPDDPLFGSCWFLEQVEAPLAWDITKGTHLVNVAIVDSGIDTGHVELRTEKWINFGEDQNGDSIITIWDWNNLDDDDNGFVDDFWGWDFVTWDNIPHPDDPTQSHGSLCASSAGAATDNGEGVASTGFNTRLMSLRSNMYSTNLAQAITYAVDNGADIISCSWGSIQSSGVISNAVQHAHNMGSIFITSAGNDDWPRPFTSWPSSYPHVISVGATNQQDQLAYFSNYCVNPWDGVIDVCAPGVNILSATSEGGYETWQGTSASTPITAGICALVLSLDPTLTPAEVETLLVHGCEDIYPQNPGFEWGILGHGRVNAFRTLLQISHYLTFEDIYVLDIGNYDGRPDPGETCELTITIFNHEDAQAAIDIEGELVCDDEAVTLLTSTVGFGSIQNGFTGINSTPFEFLVGETSPHFTDFTLVLTDAYGAVQEVQFQLELGRPEILLVDDDAGEYFQSHYQVSFDSLDIFADVWNQTEVTIDAEELQRYDVIVWETGNTRNTLDSDERDALEAFLDNGGNLLFSSTNAGADIGATSFYSDYLHAEFVMDTVLGIFYAGGVDGCPFSSANDSLFFIGGGGANNYQSLDAISPLGNAAAAFEYLNTDETAAIYFDGSYKLIYLAFPCETISGAIGRAREEVLNDMLGWFGYVSVPPLVSTQEPIAFELKQNYPNPFNPETNLTYHLLQPGEITLAIYDIQGREVARLVEGWQAAGIHATTFDGTELSSGVYFARLTAGEFHQTQKMLLVK